jgi:hypothetical protein
MLDPARGDDVHVVRVQPAEQIVCPRRSSAEESGAERSERERSSHGFGRGS